MKKRAILGAVAFAVAAITPAASVFATDGALDYANNLDALESGISANYVVEPTSDGGYIVGGRTIGCARLVLEDVASLEYDGEDYVSMEECAEVLGEIEDTVSAFDEYCGGLLRAEENYNYSYACFDYAAKFQKDGTRDWLTIVDSGMEPIGVGETDSDYRLATKGMDIFVFNKDGESIDRISTGSDARLVKFGKDGSAFAGSGFGYIEKYGPEGDLMASRPTEDEQSIYLSQDFSLEDDGLYITGLTGSEDGIGGYKLVRISKDLASEEVVMSKSGETGMLASIDGGYYMIAEGILSSEGSESEEKLVIYDKGGNKISEIGFEGFYDKFGDLSGVERGFVFTLDDGRIVKVDEKFNTMFEHTLGSGEEILDTAVLKDGSLVGVGYSTNSTENYEIDGGQNGIQLRFIIQKEDVPDDPVDDTEPKPVENPKTLDGIQIIAICGAAIILMALSLSKKVLERR